MAPANLRGLVQAQAPEHADHRAHDLLADLGDKLIVHCSCNVDLMLTVAATEGEKTNAREPDIAALDLAAGGVAEFPESPTESTPKKGGRHGS